MGSGAGSRLPTSLLVLAGGATVVAVLVSTMSILLQLRNYRKPALQRMVVRIMLMVPLYGISSLISLFSVEAAFVIDAIRDIYEAFVIYCFFVLLLSYLGGERSLLILLHGRPAKEPVFPVNLVKHEIDVSDPYTFLFLKRGILQYVQVKPILAITTLILKAVGKFNEGDFRANSGYLYVSIIYNVSICLALYCLAMFWVVVNDDLKPFRPVPKFLCVKGILFFSFWQSVVISALVAADVITHLGPYTDPESVSVGLNDLFICMEMPIFAIAHNYAFSYKDFIDPENSFVARMPMYYAFRDAFGLKDVVEDSKATLRGEGMDYREFEPAEGLMHQGVGLENRIRAGLRYSKGGQKKYWLPKTTGDTRPHGRAERVMNKAIMKVAGDDQAESVQAPLLGRQADDVVHLAPDLQDVPEDSIWDADGDEGGYELPFGDIDEADEELFDHSKKYLFGDYNYPVIDVSSESARITMWDEEERVLRDERGAWFSPIRGAKGVEALRQREGFAWKGYGAVNNSPAKSGQSAKNGKQAARFYDNGGQGSSERIIDHETERMAAADAAPKDVVMQWTKRSDSKGGSRSRTTSQTKPTSQPQSARVNIHVQRATNKQDSPSSSLGRAGSSGSGSSPQVRSPPSMSRNNSRQSGSPILPPDAVDLVVEDPHAAEEALTHERRKGEPMIRSSGLRKVYKRGFVAHDGNDDDGDVVAEGEVEIEDPAEGQDGRRVAVGEEVKEVVEEDEGRRRQESLSTSGQGALSPGSTTENKVQGVVARSGTPPLHAQVSTYRYEDIPDDHNPWA